MGGIAGSGIGSASRLGLEMPKLCAKLDMVNVSYEGVELEATTPQQLAGHLKAEITRYAGLRSKLDLRLE